MWDICIIGGGASGMAAAIAAAQEQGAKLRICILEKKEKPGKKLAATGNGRCNLTNENCINAAQTLDFFANLGIVTRKEEEGRIYPYSEKAKDVVYALKRQLRALGVTVKPDCSVTKLKAEQGRFFITHNKGREKAKRVLLAAGGKAAPHLGTTGDGYLLARKLRHTVVRLAPALTGVETAEDMTALKGLRAKGRAELLKDGRLLAAEEGEIQFTADGLSGICIFNLSRLIRLEEGEDFKTGMQRFSVALDLVPEMAETQFTELLKNRCRIVKLQAGELLLSITAPELSAYLLQRAKIDPGVPAEKLTQEELQRLAGEVKHVSLHIKGTKGWKEAQCTAGGIAMDEIHLSSMESKKVPGLYFSGEIVDYDGPCGGYNLQHAWETGIKAGRAMAHVSDSSD